jgi:sterol desaturase/sphingolipid hydroxylase (fatty acid hydroxylase superfamily)
MYDMLHFYVHHAEPGTKYGQFLKRAHLLHHFQNPRLGFGVSAPWWDYIFKTQFVRTRSRKAA